MSIRTVFRTALVIVVGTELAEGLRLDTNGPEVARALSAAGYVVCGIGIVPDDQSRIADVLSTAANAHHLVVVTGGLGPTHDDVTREAAAEALGTRLVIDRGIEESLTPVAHAHEEPLASTRVMRQAHVIEGASVILPLTGTAPGQIVPTPRGHLVLLPGPPAEMRPMLFDALDRLTHGARTAPRVLGCAGVRETDAQVKAERALEPHPGVRLAVLGRPALVDVVLFDDGAGPGGLDLAATDVSAALAPHCYATNGASLAETLIAEARSAECTIAVAESCTGGLVGASLTETPGASQVFIGGVIAYSNAVKIDLLGVPEATLAAYGAVSVETATAMAAGVRDRFSAGIAIAVTGIAGPGGGSADKPVGLVCFATADAQGIDTAVHTFRGDRSGIRARATVIALDLLRRRLATRRSP